jgi:hypothetical protein
MDLCRAVDRAVTHVSLAPSTSGCSPLKLRVLSEQSGVTVISLIRQRHRLQNHVQGPVACHQVTSRKKIRSDLKRVSF